MPPVDEEDSFEYSFSGGSGLQKNMSGHRTAHVSPSTAKFREIRLGSPLEEFRPVSEHRRSLYPSQSPIPTATLEQHPGLIPTTLPSPLPPPIPATFRGLFSLSTKGDLAIYLLPALLVAASAALVPPFMSNVIGEAFEIFEMYPLTTTSATSAERTALVSGVAKTSIKLAGAGGYAIVLNYAKGVLWARHGEALVSRLREAVYAGVQSKRMEWFDLGMGLREEETGQSETIGAGGLMAKFTR
jgi:ATP-binding cassette subfamily B (MDR/TAP) protein 1